MAITDWEQQVGILLKFVWQQEVGKLFFKKKEKDSIEYCVKGIFTLSINSLRAAAGPQPAVILDDDEPKSIFSTSLPLSERSEPVVDRYE